jgi:hypothetical protein
MGQEATSAAAHRAAHARWARKRRRLIGYGLWQPFADAEPVRQHLVSLKDGGMPLSRISAATGVHISALGACLYGTAKHPPSRQIRTESAQAVLAFHPTLDDYPPLAAIDVTGSLRRLRALAALGWTVRSVAAAAGCGAARFSRLTYTATVSAETARLIRDTYDRLWMRQPTDDEVEPAVALRTRRRAADLDWASPLAWDEQAIDDPKARPSAGRQRAFGGPVDESAVIRALGGERVELGPGERTAAVERGVRQGLSYQTVADVLGIEYDTVRRTFERCKARARERGEKWPDQVVRSLAA